MTQKWLVELRNDSAVLTSLWRLLKNHPQAMQAVRLAWSVDEESKDDKERLDKWLYNGDYWDELSS